MSDQQPRDFYIGDAVVGTYQNGAVGKIRFAWKSRNFYEAMVQWESDSFLCLQHADSVVHASDGAPLGKFRGFGAGPPFRNDAMQEGRERELARVNRILGAEVDDD